MHSTCNTARSAGVAKALHNKGRLQFQDPGVLESDVAQRLSLSRQVVNAKNCIWSCRGKSVSQVGIACCGHSGLYTESNCGLRYLRCAPSPAPLVRVSAAYLGPARQAWSPWLFVKHKENEGCV